MNSESSSARRREQQATSLFPSQMRPLIHQLRIYGPKNGLVLDQDHEILIQLRGQKLKSYADIFVPPVLFAKQHLGNLTTNARLFLGRDLHMDFGMKYLIESFYRAIRERTPRCPYLIGKLYSPLELRMLSSNRSALVDHRTLPVV